MVDPFCQIERNKLPNHVHDFFTWFGSIFFFLKAFFIILKEIGMSVLRIIRVVNQFYLSLKILDFLFLYL